MMLEPPNLATLLQQPSWLNRAGRIDRSACFEIRASELWPYAVMDEPNRYREDDDDDASAMAAAGPPSRQTAGKSPSAPKSRAAGTAATTKRMANARVSVYLAAGDLRRLHSTRKPRVLQGDFRTAKSNAMRPADDSPPGVVRAQRIKIRKRASWSPEEVALSQRRLHQDMAAYQSNAPRGSIVWDAGRREADGLPGNPNKGATCTKVLALPEGWGQSIVIERRRLNPRLARHFFECPGCRKETMKLFLPLATRGEVRDAAVARVWLMGLRDPRRGRANAPGTEAERVVIERYGPLLNPASRLLKCGRCLGVRYGEYRGPRKIPATREPRVNDPRDGEPRVNNPRVCACKRPAAC